MRLTRRKTPAGLILALAAALSCSTHVRLDTVRRKGMGAEIVAADRSLMPKVPDEVFIPQDTLIVDDPDGGQMIVMKAGVGENGEVIASDVLKAAVVTARFKNVAERGGKVDIRFQILVPSGMIDNDWQLRFSPTMYMLGDSLSLENVLITGKGYRSRQLRGYEQYRKFLASIITDSTMFIYGHQLEVFLRRNLPEIYRFRNDSSFVSDEEFASHYGVTERQAVEHYTSWMLVRRNRRKIESKDKMFRRYVKAPIESEGLRLDTVLSDESGNFIYEYVQRVKTRPALRKVDVVLDGSIYREDVEMYDIPRSRPLTFYISSLSSLADGSPRYLRKVVTRKVEANTACHLDFEAGKYDVDLSLGDNRYEVARIKETLAGILDKSGFDLDSIIVTATCSPEGSWTYNKGLSFRRSGGVSDYFGKYIREWRDSAARNAPFTIDMSGEERHEASAPDIRFISKENPENWEALDKLVASDTVLTEAFKEGYRSAEKIKDPDEREHSLRSLGGYAYMRSELYPKLRTVRFDFHLHRRGMIRDTLITTELDSSYMAGVKALADRDYERAVTLLKPYNDYNTAVAYCAMDYNATALKILEDVPESDRVHYLKAILHSRKGDVRKAVEYYLLSCRENPGFISRGNLDPEISELIRAYGLNKEQ